MLARPVLVGLASLLIAVAGTIDVAWYFGPWAKAYPWADVTAQARTIAALGPGYQVFNAGRPFVFVAHGNTRYLAESVGPKDLGNAIDLPAPPLARPLAVIVNPGLSHYLPLLKDLYPGATVTPVERPAGKLVLTQVTVPAERAVEAWPAGQGLSFEIRPADSDRVSARGVDRLVASRLMNSRAPVADKPFRAAWRGQLVAPANGSYQLELVTDGESTLRLDGRTLLTTEANPGRLTQRGRRREPDGRRAHAGAGVPLRARHRHDRADLEAAGRRAEHRAALGAAPVVARDGQRPKPSAITARNEASAT